MDVKQHITGLAKMGLIIGLLCSAQIASGDERANIQALQRLHEGLCDPGRVLSAEQGQQALESLREWNLSTNRLDQEQNRWLLETEIYAALAIGDVQRAARKMSELRQLFPERREMLEAAYLVATAAGDGEAGQGALKALGKVVDSKERKALGRRRRWSRHLGQPVPDVDIPLEDGNKMSARQRYGNVLVVDFWNTHDVTEQYAQALKTLRAAYSSEFRVQFVGINSDSEARVDQARAFAEAAGYTWPQHYERKAGRAPITHKAFHAGSPPWTVVIDGAGRIRAVGAVTEPAFCYALRATVAEVTGKLAGERPAPHKGKKRVAKSDLPSDPEAQALLRKARTFLKTGMKKKAKELLKEIIRKYPGTREARDAQERLDYLP